MTGPGSRAPSPFVGGTANFPEGAIRALAIAAALSICAGAIASAGATETRCVRTYLIHTTRRSSDGAFIDFDMRGGTVYRNTLRNRCPGLKSNGFGYKTSGGSLCKGSIIHVARSGGTCILGSFVEISRR